MVFTYKQEDLREAWIMPDYRVFSGVTAYVRLAVPSTIMMCLEWWVWEVMVLISGWLGVVE